MALRPVNDSFGKDTSGLAPHDRVRIGGRTMLRPGFSLVGHEATVFAIGGWCPPGHAQVIVDGEVVEEDEGARVLLVNVPLEHLELIAPRVEKVEEAPHPFRPRLAPVQPEESADDPFDDAPDTPPDDSPDDAPKGLRLV
ncbi:MAG TPA: hypothetical protein VF681_09550 [Abditibacteriaceae bacterium]|jgi:hypothetical protein